MGEVKLPIWVCFTSLILFSVGVSAQSCTSTSCVNGGSCVSSTDQLTNITSSDCQCVAGYFGQTCSETICTTLQPCMNGGECVVINSQQYVCTCATLFMGTNCTTAIDPTETEAYKVG